MSIVVNLFGGPGAGKSTTRAGVFHKLKLAGVNCEEVPEFAKDLTWEERKFALSCQPYVTGEQLYRMERVLQKVDVVITDSPIIMACHYGKISGRNYPTSFYDWLIDQFYMLGDHQLNYYIRRVKPYNPKGRNQTEEESNTAGTVIKQLLNDLGINYTILNGDEKAAFDIVSDVTGLLYGR